MTADLTAKPAYNEMQLLIQSLNGEHFTAQLNDGNARDWLLVFTSPSGQETLAAWTTGNNDLANVPGWGNLNLTSTPSYVVDPVPEPSALSLLAAGAVSTLAYAWRQQRRTGIANRSNRNPKQKAIHLRMVLCPMSIG